MVQKLLNLVLAGCTFTQKWQHSHLVLPEELVMVCLLHSDCKTRPQKLHELFYANIFFSNAFPLFLIQFLGWAVLQSTALSYFGFIGAIHRDWMHLVFSSHFPVNNGMGFFFNDSALHSVQKTGLSQVSCLAFFLLKLDVAGKG